ncbi:MAG: hypothetical protein HZA93_23740 [Verrucomicrobia bacterium]|nr:hypothetical protein [Verrucomicrobiota bacterium]
MSDKPATRIASFVLENLDGQPRDVRLTLLRDLIAVSPPSAQRRDLEALAAAEVEIGRRERQLVLDFKRRAL